jgi:hypothetical protein
MEIKHLEALLKRLKDFGVATYQDADVKLTFAGAEPVFPAAADTSFDGAGDLDLPEKVLDPRKVLADIYKKRQVPA